MVKCQCAVHQSGILSGGALSATNIQGCSRGIPGSRASSRVIVYLILSVFLNDVLVIPFRLQKLTNIVVLTDVMMFRTNLSTPQLLHRRSFRNVQIESYALGPSFKGDAHLRGLF